jgi:hypothetical protein
MRKPIDRGIGCVPILHGSLQSVSASNFIVRKIYCALIFCHTKSCLFFLFCNNCLCCRPLLRSVILSSGSTLRLRSQTSSFYKAWRSGMRSVRRYWRSDVERRLYKRSTRKRRKGGVLLHTGRRERRSLSVCAERRQRWRRIPMPRRRESGLVELSSLHDLLVLWFIHEQCCLVLDFAMCSALFSLSSCSSNVTVLFNMPYYWKANNEHMK